MTHLLTVLAALALVVLVSAVHRLEVSAWHRVTGATAPVEGPRLVDLRVSPDALVWLIPAPRTSPDERAA